MTATSLADFNESLIPQLVPLGHDFDRLFDAILTVKLFLEKSVVTPSQLINVLKEHDETGLTIEYLLVRHQSCPFQEALKIIHARREVLELIQHHA